MDYLGDNKWSVERKPSVQGRWLLVTGGQLINCRLEEVTPRDRVYRLYNKLPDW
jgi:hypothetical protein